MIPGAANLRYTLADLEAMATIRPVIADGGRKERMGCGFHGSDHQLSLEVHLETGRFSCHNCGVWGFLTDGPASKSGVLMGALAGSRSYSRTVLKKSSLQEDHTGPEMSRVIPQDLNNPKLGRYLEAAQRHLEAPSALVYLEARKVSMTWARSIEMGYFPSGTWPGRKVCRNMGRVAFPLHGPTGELVGIYSRAVDPQYPERKVPERVRHDIWGKRGIFNPGALAGPALYLTESCFDAVAMLAAGYPTSAALVGTKGLRWEWLAQVRELWLCGDTDLAGLKASKELARDGVLHGVRVYTPGPAETAYGGYVEPSEQWEAEGRVTLRSCGDCNVAIHPPTAERCPTCGAPMCTICQRCDPCCPIMGGL